MNCSTQTLKPEQIKRVADAALARLQSLCESWLPDGQREGDEWSARNPTRADRNPGSFKVNLNTGKWCDFATDDRGSDPVDLRAYLDRIPQGEAAAKVAADVGIVFDQPSGMARPAESRNPRESKARPAGGKSVPADWEELPKLGRRHKQHGEASAEWVYQSADSKILAVITRHDPPGARKQFIPHTWDGRRWQRKAPPEPRPLYGLDRLAARPDAPVLLCEGEKAADAAAALMPDAVCIASMGGSKAANKADWSPLQGRSLLIWPDADKPGAQYARAAAALAYGAGAVSVSIMRTPEDAPEGWDAADAVSDGWTAAALAAQAWDARPNPYDEPEPTATPSGSGFPPAPAGWILSCYGVKEDREEGDPIKVCGPLWIVGRTTGPHGEWGVVLVFRDHDGTDRRLAIPADRLHEDATILARELARMGLGIIPGKEKKMLAYLAAWQPEDRILSAKRLGWLEDRTGALAFVMPDRVIRQNGDGDVIFQPERFSPTAKTVHSRGTLADWQAQVAAPVCDHDMMLFALSAGLATAFLAYAEATDSFILHFTGKTTRGKTALAQIAASPWGCAADPNDAPSITFVRRWNVTANGLEGLAEAHSDMPLVLDELGSSNVSDVRPMVYALAGGQGKTALNSAREMKEPRSWRTIAISTGEMSLQEKMTDPTGDGRRSLPVKGGLTHRALDIEIDDIAEGIPLNQRAARVQSIKVACRDCYGTAGPALIKAMTEHFASAAAVRAYARDAVGTLAAEIDTDGALPQEGARALRRFALIALAGCFAADIGLIPTTRDKVITATRAAVATWKGADQGTDAERIIARIQAFIFTHESRFQRINDSTIETDPKPEHGPFSYHNPAPRPFVVADRAGWHDIASDLWYFTDSALKEAAPGNDTATIARAIQEHGHLHTDDSSRLKARLSVLIDGKRPRAYAVKGTIIEAEKVGQRSKTAGQAGQAGQSQAAQGFQSVPIDDGTAGQAGQDDRDGTENAAAVPVCPAVPQAPGQKKNQQPQGFVPPVPPVPPKNRATPFSPTRNDDAMAF